PKGGLPRQNLHNGAWALWAATTVEGSLTKAERKELIDQLLDRQQEDGGWGLPSLGGWVRSDGTAQETASDGYATGLVLHVLQTAGGPKDDRTVGEGLDWLNDNQRAPGGWRGVASRTTRNVPPPATPASSCRTQRPPMPCSPSATEPSDPRRLTRGASRAPPGNTMTAFRAASKSSRTCSLSTPSNRGSDS